MKIDLGILFDVLRQKKNPRRAVLEIVFLMFYILEFLLLIIVFLIFSLEQGLLV